MVWFEEVKDWAADNNNKLSLFGANWLLHDIVSVCAEEQSNYKHYLEMCFRHDDHVVRSLEKKSPHLVKNVVFLKHFVNAVHKHVINSLYPTIM